MCAALLLFFYLCVSPALCDKLQVQVCHVTHSYVHRCRDGVANSFKYGGHDAYLYVSDDSLICET